MEHINLIVNNCITYNGMSPTRFGPSIYKPAISRTSFDLCLNNVVIFKLTIGFNSDLTKNAQRMLEICVAEMKEVRVCMGVWSYHCSNYAG